MRIISYIILIQFNSKVFIHPIKIYIECCNVMTKYLTGHMYLTCYPVYIGEKIVNLLNY